MKYFLLINLIVVFAFVSVSNGQKIEKENSSDNSVPETTIREVIRRILVYRFKPVRQRKVIYLAQKGVDQSWLPSIQNIEFRLLSDEEIEDRATELYFFTEPKRSGQIYEIGFAFGNPDCRYSGESWSFRVVADRVRLWQGGGFGSGCGGSDSEFKFPGQLNTYPNELKDYRFFDQGKLKGLKLTISSRADVKNNFGTDCQPSCDYDRNWTVHFTYFNDFHREITKDEKRIKIVNKEEYTDKLYSITLTPKSKILFDKVTFPPNFKKSTVYTAAHDGKGGGTNSTHDIYFDRFGLKYSLLNNINLTTIKNLEWRRGELDSIEYTIPEKLEEAMYRVKE